MRMLVREEAGAVRDQYWDDMRDEWFKVEVLQDYSGEDDGPSLRSWLAGDKKRSIGLMKNDPGDSEWVEMCRQKLGRGVKLLRIHPVEEPYTPYLEWEIEYYNHVNIPRCGEKVYLINKAVIKNLKLPGGDIMIFDKERVAVDKYNNRGFMTHTNSMIITTISINF